MQQATADRSNEAGATATEYVFLLAFIALIAAAGMTLYGGTLQGAFGESVAEVDAVTPSS